MITWNITKRLTGGILDGIVVSDTLTQDARFGAPFADGQFVKSCAGSNYTVLSVSRA